MYGEQLKRKCVNLQKMYEKSVREVQVNVALARQMHLAGLPKLKLTHVIIIRTTTTTTTTTTTKIMALLFGFSEHLSNKKLPDKFFPH